MFTAEDTAMGGAGSLQGVVTGVIGIDGVHGAYTEVVLYSSAGPRHLIHYVGATAFKRRG